MKPLQVAVLVVAGGMAGAVVMRVWQKPLPEPAPASAVAEAPATAPAAPAVPTTPAAAPPAVSLPVYDAPIARPKPLTRSAAARSEPVHVRPPVTRVVRNPPVRRPEPVELAKSEAAVVAPPEPQKEAAAPSLPTPPARPEPENVTPPVPPPAPPEPEPNRVTLNAGLLIPVRLVDGLSSERNVPGDAFTATLYRELVVDGFVIAERGARVEGRVVSADRGGKVRGVSSLAVELIRIHTSDGQSVPVQTDRFERQADASHQTDAAKVGGGAALGAIIGGLAGGGKGAAIGAGVGGGAGAGDVLLTRGKPATLPSEMQISFRLRAPVTLTEQR